MLGRADVVYEFGSIRIDLSKRTISRNGENGPCSSRAFDALLLLVQRRGEVVTKGELLTTLWPDTHVEEANVPVVISAVRRAVGDDGRKQEYIQTVSKYGYRFVGEVKEIRLEEPGAPPTPSPAVIDVVARSVTQRYARVAILTVCITAALAISFFVYWPRNGSSRTLPVISSASGDPKAGNAEIWVEKGRYAWNLQTKDGFLRSIEYYRKAIGEDAGSAAAYAGLAESYVTLPSYSARNNDEDRGRARTAAIKAVALDNNLAEAHIALGMVSMIDDRSFAAGEREFRRAIELDPRSPLAQGELALCLVAVGRSEEAVSHARQAGALDPLSIRAAADLGIVLYYSHRYTEAQREFEEALKLDPYSYRAHVNLGKTYLALGRIADARRVLKQASVLSNHDPLAEGLMAEARAKGGDIEGAQFILKGLEQRARTSYVAPVSFAFAYAAMGRYDDTLMYLRKARADRAIAALFLKVDPNWDTLHVNPDFRNLVGDITLSTSE